MNASNDNREPTVAELDAALFHQLTCPAADACQPRECRACGAVYCEACRKPRQGCSTCGHCER